MKLQTERQGDTLVVRVPESRIDAAAAIRFKEAMRVAVAGGPEQATPRPRVILDLSAVDFLDSSGLGAVVAVMKMLAPDRRLELAGMTPNVAKVFRLTRMDQVFTLHADPPPAAPPAGPHAG